MHLTFGNLAVPGRPFYNGINREIKGNGFQMKKEKMRWESQY